MEYDCTSIYINLRIKMWWTWIKGDTKVCTVQTNTPANVSNITCIETHLAKRVRQRSSPPVVQCRHLWQASNLLEKKKRMENARAGWLAYIFRPRLNPGYLQSHTRGTKWDCDCICFKYHVCVFVRHVKAKNIHICVLIIIY